MSNEPLPEQRVDCCDGKYTVIHSCGMGLRALRYGKSWGRDLVGDGLVLALAIDLADARTELQQAQAALAAVTLERDETKKISREWQTIAVQQMQSASKDLREIAHLDQLLGEARSALAARQSCEAKALSAAQWLGEQSSAQNQLIEEYRGQLNEALQQLAACQSQNAKRLTELPQILGHLATVETCAAFDEHHAITETLLKRTEADRDQLQAQVGALRGALECVRDNIVTFDSGAHPVAYLDNDEIALIHAALAQPPSAPDSAKDGARLDAVFAHGFIRWIADGPYKGKLLVNREMLDTAISTTP